MKKYVISQTVDYNGQILSGGFVVHAASDGDLQKLLGALEGKYTVMEENPTLSGGTDATATKLNKASLVSITHVTPDGDYVPLAIKPYRGKIYIKNTVDDDALADMVKGASFIKYAPTAKADYAGFKSSARSSSSNE